MSTRATYRAIGAAPLVVRSIVVPPALFAGIALWSVGNTVLMIAVPVLMLAAAWVVTLIPRIEVAGGELIVRRLFSVERFDAAGVTIQQVPSSVLWYRTWNLVLVTSDSAHPFAWISWYRHELSRPWGEPTPPPRAVRFADHMTSSIEAAD